MGKVRVGVIAMLFAVMASVGTASKETSTMATTPKPFMQPAAQQLQQQPFMQPAAEGYYGTAEPVAPSYSQDYSTGYDTGYAAAPAPRMLASSPEWLAYLNALGLEEQQARADVDKQRGLYQSDATRQLQDLPAGYMQQRRGITGSMESRGMARSGEMLRRLAENRANQGRAEAGVNAQLGFQLGNLESSLANKLIQLNSARAQQEMNLRAQGYQ